MKPISIDLAGIDGNVIQNIGGRIPVIILSLQEHTIHTNILFSARR